MPAQEPTAKIRREFTEPSGKELAALQGRACLRCGATRGRLVAAGTAVSVVGQQRQTWHVRMCERCVKAEASK